MALIEINKNPNKKELFSFGWMFPVFFTLFGFLLQWKLESWNAAKVTWITAAIITLLFWILPFARKSIYRAWLLITFPIGWLISHALLAIIYFGIITPIGLFMKLGGRDPMQRRFEPEKESYWTPVKPAGNMKRYFRQF